MPESVDFSGIPEPIAQKLREAIFLAREYAKSNRRGKKRKGIHLTPVKNGKVLTPLTRKEIYDLDDE